MSTITMPLWAVWTILAAFFSFTGWLTWKLTNERIEAGASIEFLTKTILKQSERVKELQREIDRLKSR